MDKYTKGLKALGRGFKEGIKQHREKDIDYKIKYTELELERTKVNHILHLLLSIFTIGIWVIVWIFVYLNVNSKRNALKRKLKKFYRIKEEKISAYRVKTID